MKILVTDDSRVMRQIVVRTLRQAGLGGHEVVEAENGRDALEKIRTEEPDVVLSDWNMPVMDGITLLATLRRRGHALPFGFVTSEGSPEMRARAEQVGADFVIAKPFTPDAFAEALASVLGGR